MLAPQIHRELLIAQSGSKLLLLDGEVLFNLGEASLVETAVRELLLLLLQVLQVCSCLASSLGVLVLYGLQFL